MNAITVGWQDVVERWIAYAEELEKRVAQLESARDSHVRLVEAKDARIAELEASLEYYLTPEELFEVSN